MSDIIDVTYLVFGQAIPRLGADARLDIVDCINDGDHDVALDLLIKFIDEDNISIDPDLLRRAREIAPNLI